MAHQAPEPIAITGMACRLPGGIRSPSDLWNLLVKEQTGQCPVPATRFNIDAFYHPHGDKRLGSMNMQSGYFIQEDIRQFDNSFFRINNIEATYMDPQQRKLLEVVYECLESAGQRFEDMQGANVGVYCGNFATEFEIMQCLVICLRSRTGYRTGCHSLHWAAGLVG
ncbi:beta-ketoacyl synthase [Aspergillus germanicus]